MPLGKTAAVGVKPAAPAPGPQTEVIAAREAGLRYVPSQSAGIRRAGSGRAFRYLDSRGKRIDEEPTLRRIRALAIPPAWTQVWISADPTGHLQATGRDIRGRKQYRYHRRWRAVRDESKFSRMIAFGRALPAIRQRVRRDLRSRGLGRDKVLAAVVRLMDLCAIRVGNDEYASENKSYGLTTLQDRHARIRGSVIRLQFRGKSGKAHDITVDHPRLARIVKRCRDLPGQELFQYLDENGKVHDIGSGDVNGYLLEISGSDFTSKDFRTWTGTVFAALELTAQGPARSAAESKRNVVRAIERVAEKLGNTPAVCRKCYVHPDVIEGYARGSMIELVSGPSGRAGRGLLPGEAALVRFLRRRSREQGEAALARRLKQSLRRSRTRRRGGAAG